MAERGKDVIRPVNTQDGGMAEQQTGVVGRAKAVLSTARRRAPVLDHVILMLQHYGRVSGGTLAGGVTYFGFLSFFPLLALAFSVVGFISAYSPHAEKALVEAIQQVFPGIVTVNGAHWTISMRQVQQAKGAAGAIGLVVLAYT
ncbi:MAG: YhjD/YihY/BrkB family envelope integrity protein, partial [Nocardioidaceae bacterium]